MKTFGKWLEQKLNETFIITSKVKGQKVYLTPAGKFSINVQKAAQFNNNQEADAILYKHPLFQKSAYGEDAELVSNAKIEQT